MADTCQQGRYVFIADSATRALHSKKVYTGGRVSTITTYRAFDTTQTKIKYENGLLSQYQLDVDGKVHTIARYSTDPQNGNGYIYGYIPTNSVFLNKITKVATGYKVEGYTNGLYGEVIYSKEQRGNDTTVITEPLYKTVMYIIKNTPYTETVYTFNDTTQTYHETMTYDKQGRVVNKKMYLKPDFILTEYDSIIKQYVYTDSGCTCYLTEYTTYYRHNKPAEYSTVYHYNPNSHEQLKQRHDAYIEDLKKKLKGKKLARMLRSADGLIFPAQ